MWAAMKASFALMSSPPTERKKPRPCAEPPPPPSDVCCPGAAAPVRPPRPAAARSPRPSPRPPAQAAMSSTASASPQAQPPHSPASPPAPKGAQPPAPCTPAKTAASSASSSHPSRSVGTLPTGPESGSNVIQERGGPADLGRRQALQAELGHHLGGIAGGDALHVHLGDRQHHRARGPAPALQRLRIERLVNSSGLGYVDGHRPGRGIDCLALVAVGIAAPIGVAFVQPGPEEALPLQAHGEIEQRREHLCHPVRAFGDELFHESGHDRILGLRHPVFLLDNRNNRYAVEPLLQSNFQTSGYTSRPAGHRRRLQGHAPA